MDDNKPEGQKCMNPQKPAIRVNWKSPFLWGQIEMAATILGKPWRPHDIILQEKCMDPVAFCHLTKQVVGRWIDQEAQDKGVYKWKDSVLEGVQKGNADALCSDITLLKLLIYKNARQTNPSFVGYG
jgi:hypothetical protein